MTALHHSHARSHVTQTCNVLDVSLDVFSRAFFYRDISFSCNCHEVSQGAVTN